MYCLCSENKGADQLRGYRAADMRLCFCIYKKQVFSGLAKLGYCVTHKKFYHLFSHSYYKSSLANSNIYHKFTPQLPEYCQSSKQEERSPWFVQHVTAYVKAAETTVILFPDILLPSDNSVQVPVFQKLILKCKTFFFPLAPFFIVKIDICALKNKNQFKQ